MTRAEVCRRLEEVGIVPVVRLPSAALAVRAVEAVLAGGISVVEITMTVPEAIGLIRSLRDRFGDRALVGAGTVLTAAQAQECIDAGAQFILSPGTDLATIELCRARDIVVIPGALTPTEVIAASKAGADMVKIFPCSALGGAKYLRALKGPLPDVKMLPTGGVSVATAPEYIAAGAAALGVGSELVDPAALQAGQDEIIRERAQKLRVAVSRARAELLD
jgi:2-dehydro-3-deoxyphosphogluconate aldolase/(4S)-4-hydroxy-2-oxoglutarate aldolase